jgi:hypothetical protein
MGVLLLVEAAVCVAVKDGVSVVVAVLVGSEVGVTLAELVGGAKTVGVSVGESVPVGVTD